MGTGKAYVRATVKGIGYDCLLDSGSELSIFPHYIVNSATIRPTSVRMNAANGTPIEILGQAEVASNFDGKIIISVSVLVSDKVWGVMLGEDFLFTNQAVLDFSDGQLCIQDKKLPLYAAPPPVMTWTRRVTVSKSAIISGPSEVVMQTRQQYHNRRCASKTPNWQNKCQGSHQVVANISESNFTVQKNQSSSRIMAHVDHIKAYNGPWMKQVPEENNKESGNSDVSQGRALGKTSLYPMSAY